MPNRRSTPDSASRLQAVLDTAVDAIITIDQRGTIQSVNKATERLFGYSSGELIGSNVSLLMPEPYRGKHDGYLAKYLRTGRKRIIGIGREVLARRKDESTFPVDLAVSEVEPGRLFTGIIRDITERKKSEDSIRRSEARLRSLLETAVDSVITINGRGVIQSANPATERMFGYGAAELIGRNVSMLMPSPYREDHDGYLARYIDTGERRIIGIGREVQAQRQDGTIFPVDLAVSEVEPGKLFTGVIRDISDRKMSEARLREADRMASIGALAAGLGHDMNNVLLPVRAHLNVLKSTANAGRSGIAAHVGKIHQGVAYLQQLADGLHFLAMDPDQDLDTGGTTDLHVWWGQTGALLRKAVPKHVKVIATFSKSLPEASIAAHALTQAVLNLIVNAGEAIPPGRKRRQGYVRLSAEPAADGAFITVSVNDNGSGMTGEVKRRAFDMFFTTKPRGLGTGLGLAMVRRVVDRAGGTVDIESTLGKGTTITLKIPVARRGENASSLNTLVRIKDGRTASLIASFLESCGVHAVRGDSHPAEIDVLVVDLSKSNLDFVASWRKRRPTGKLILVGTPSPKTEASWRHFEPLNIHDPHDLDEVRAVIGMITIDQRKE